MQYLIQKSAIFHANDNYFYKYPFSRIDYIDSSTVNYLPFDSTNFTITYNAIKNFVQNNGVLYFQENFSDFIIFVNKAEYLNVVNNNKQKFCGFVYTFDNLNKNIQDYIYDNSDNIYSDFSNLFLLNGQKFVEFRFTDVEGIPAVGFIDQSYIPKNALKIQNALNNVQTDLTNFAINNVCNKYIFTQPNIDNVVHSINNDETSIYFHSIDLLNVGNICCVIPNINSNEKKYFPILLNLNNEFNFAVFIVLRHNNERNNYKIFVLRNLLYDILRLTNENQKNAVKKLYKNFGKNNLNAVFTTYDANIDYSLQSVILNYKDFTSEDVKIKAIKLFNDQYTITPSINKIYLKNFCLNELYSFYLLSYIHKDINIDKVFYIEDITSENFDETFLNYIKNFDYNFTNEFGLINISKFTIPGVFYYAFVTSIAPNTATDYFDDIASINYYNAEKYSDFYKKITNRTFEILNSFSNGKIQSDLQPAFLKNIYIVNDELIENINLFDDYNSFQNDLIYSIHTPSIISLLLQRLLNHLSDYELHKIAIIKIPLKTAVLINEDENQISYCNFLTNSLVKNYDGIKNFIQQFKYNVKNISKDFTDISENNILTFEIFDAKNINETSLFDEIRTFSNIANIYNEQINIDNVQNVEFIENLNYDDLYVIKSTKNIVKNIKIRFYGNDFSIETKQQKSSFDALNSSRIFSNDYQKSFYILDRYNIYYDFNGAIETEIQTILDNTVCSFVNIFEDFYGAKTNILNLNNTLVKLNVELTPYFQFGLFGGPLKINILHNKTLTYMNYSDGIIIDEQNKNNFKIAEILEKYIKNLSEKTIVHKSFVKSLLSSKDAEFTTASLIKSNICNCEVLEIDNTVFDGTLVKDFSNIENIKIRCICNNNNNINEIFNNAKNFKIFIEHNDTLIYLRIQTTISDATFENYEVKNSIIKKLKYIAENISGVKIRAFLKLKFAGNLFTNSELYSVLLNNEDAIKNLLKEKYDFIKTIYSGKTTENINERKRFLADPDYYITYFTMFLRNFVYFEKDSTTFEIEINFVANKSNAYFEMYEKMLLYTILYHAEIDFNEIDVIFNNFKVNEFKYFDILSNAEILDISIIQD